MSEVTSRQLVLYAVCAVVVATVGYAYLRQGHPSSEAQAGRPRVVKIQGQARKKVVHVAGAVRRPGVYRVRGGRVGDAVRRAGGARRDADLDSINLAAIVEDGQQIVVPFRQGRGRPGPATAGASGDAEGGMAGKVSLNTASAEELQTLGGVGPATAEKIIAFRKEHGGFKSIEDLMEVPGIGPKRFDAIKDGVQA